VHDHSDSVAKGSALAAKPATSPPPSRRQAHKIRTERTLQQAALELFAKQGYDETTTEEIAERSGVSPRTFFRYFPTKESVLFVGEYRWVQSFTTAFLEQPRALSDLDALCETLVSLAGEHSARRRSLVLYERAVASSPTLRGGVHDHQQEDIEKMAEAIATRRRLRKPDDECILLAAVCLVTYRRALSMWLAGPAKADPKKVIEDHFTMLRGFARQTRSSERR
jgi:AcrR family transcriptional regulator